MRPIDVQTRNRLLDEKSGRERAPDPAAGLEDAALVVTFKKTLYPTAAKSVFACHLGKLVIGGAGGAEGDPVSVVALDDEAVVANIGAAVPPENTAMIADAIDGYLVSRYNG